MIARLGIGLITPGYGILTGAMMLNSAPAEVLLTDADMEAVGTTGWATYQASVSKTTDTPYDGTQSLRVTADGTHAFGQVSQAKLVVNCYYRVIAHCRGDGSASPRIYWGGSNYYQGSTSTAWQLCSLSKQCTGNTNLGFGSGAFTATHYVDFDDIRVFIVPA